MHWILDVVFREDDSRKRAGHAGANLAMIRRVAVALLRHSPGKGSIAFGLTPIFFRRSQRPDALVVWR